MVLLSDFTSQDMRDAPTAKRNGMLAGLARRFTEELHEALSKTHFRRYSTRYVRWIGVEAPYEVTLEVYDWRSCVVRAYLRPIEPAFVSGYDPPSGDTRRWSLELTMLAEETLPLVPFLAEWICHRERLQRKDVDYYESEAMPKSPLEICPKDMRPESVYMWTVAANAIHDKLVSDSKA